MIDNYLYEQVNGLVAITSECFDYHCIGDACKLTQKKKIPSLRLVRRFCKSIVKQNKHVDIVQQRVLDGVKTREVMNL